MPHKPNKALAALALLCALVPALAALRPHAPAQTDAPARMDGLPDLAAADEPLEVSLMPMLEEDLAGQTVLESVLPEAVGDAQTGDALPAADAPVSVHDGEAGGGGVVYVRNLTDYAVDAAAMLDAPYPLSLGSSGPQVLIMHTHGTEAYTPTAAEPYTESDSYRTTDRQHNMLRVGALIAEILNEHGIETVHSQTLNDYPAYNGAYNRALRNIESYTAKYPSLRLVIDVHRDAMASGSTVYKTSAEVDGAQTAQLMFVVGTDAGGLSHDGWRQNLTAQVHLYDRLNTAYPGIMRPITVRKERFNQHVRVGSMLLEVGSHGNTLEEALAAARIFAEGLAAQLGK